MRSTNPKIPSSSVAPHATLSTRKPNSWNQINDILCVLYKDWWVKPGDTYKVAVLHMHAKFSKVGVQNTLKY